MTHAVEASPSVADPFDAGPFARPRSAGAERRFDRSRAGRRALIAAAVAWVPLAVLAAAQGYALRDSPHESLLLDLSAYARYLVALPLLLVAEAVCLPRLALIARHFGAAGLVSDADRPRYDQLLTDTRRLLHSRRAELAIVAGAYLLALSLGRLVGAVPYVVGGSTWVAPIVNGARSISLAGVWRAFVSQPLLLVVLGAWLWRLAIWTRFLRGVARLELRLIPSHPDGAGGLRFVATSLPPFAVPAFALGAWAAGGVANAVLYDARSPRELAGVVVVVVLLVLVLFAGPLLVLAGPLLRARLRGLLEYGALAGALGQRFEERWLERPAATDPEALAAPDFSATTDLYSVMERARAMRVLPFDVRGVLPLVAATLAPFLPVLLVVVPLEQVLRFMGRLLR